MEKDEEKKDLEEYMEELNHLTFVIERGEGAEEYIFLDGEWYTAEEYLSLHGFEYNAWREM